MPDLSLLTNLVQASAATAAPIAQAYAEGNMTYAITLTRPGKPTFDRDTGQMTPVSADTIYTGKARVYEVQGGQTYQLGDEPQVFATTFVSIPVSAPRPQAEDIVTITASPDPVLVNRRYRVTGVNTGGFIPDVHRMSVIGAEPAPNAT